MRQAIILVLLFFTAPTFGAFTVFRGEMTDVRYAPVRSAEEHYDIARQWMELKRWEEARTNFLVIVFHFKESPHYADALFYTGVCNYKKKEFVAADDYFSSYLAHGSDLKHVEKIFNYKFQMAEKYAAGARKRMLGKQKMPKLASGTKEALRLYDEVSAALPSQEIAAKALFRKAHLLRKKKQYKESIEAYQTLMRRFPKHTLAAESYLQTSDVYLCESRLEPQNPDILALAEVNILRFQKQFPGDERIALAHANVTQMKEVYSRSLLETGRFYEKKRKPQASRIYYENAMRRYPETEGALKSEQRLSRLFPAPNQEIVQK